MIPSISEEKNRIRDRIRALRHSLSPEKVHAAGLAICQTVCSRILAGDTRSVCVYASTGKEIPTEELMTRLLGDGIKVAVPDWEGWKQGSGLRVVAIESTGELLRDGRVVPQPAVVEGRMIPVEELDLFLVPGIAFDRSGNRLGMGGGYFDRLLARASSSATFTGLAYEFQIVTHLPSEDHDIPVHNVVTPGLSQVEEVEHKREGNWNVS